MVLLQRVLLFENECMWNIVYIALRNYIHFYLPTYGFFRNALSQFGLDLPTIAALRNYWMTPYQWPALLVNVDSNCFFLHIYWLSYRVFWLMWVIFHWNIWHYRHWQGNIFNLYIYKLGISHIDQLFLGNVENIIITHFVSSSGPV